MKTQKVFVKAYNAEIDFPTIILSGDCMMSLRNMMVVLGVDELTSLPLVNPEELTNDLVNNYTVITCEGFNPSVEYIRGNKQYLFISSEYITTSENAYYAVINDENLPYNLAEFTGISAFKNLRWSDQNKIWFLYGAPTTLNKHNHAKLITRFAGEMARWYFAGKPCRPADAVAHLFDTVCTKCSEYIVGNKPEEGTCNICGCRIAREVGTPRWTNKLVVGTASCPMDPPKFRATRDVSVEQIKGREEELYAKYVRDASHHYGTLQMPCKCK